jgi:hypothetical protein
MTDHSILAFRLTAVMTRIPSYYFLSQNGQKYALTITKKVIKLNAENYPLPRKTPFLRGDFKSGFRLKTREA